MKHFIFCALFVLLNLTSFSLLAKGSFEPQVKANVDFGVDHDKNFSFGADFLAGYRINPRLRVGVGVGISYVDLLYEDANFSMGRFNDKYKESAAYIPVFANVKYNFTEANVSPFINVDGGYSIFIPCSDYAEENKLGLFLTPSLGCDFKSGIGKFFVQIGYKYQLRQCDYWEDTNGDYSQLSIAIGYQF